MSVVPLSNTSRTEEIRHHPDTLANGCSMPRRSLMPLVSFEIVACALSAPERRGPARRRPD